ncbi:hypothetical protein [Roseibium aggregatum]|uniref:Uncharacterized protein n=1 Tax=Roseibium aggregatum TaxID=187304 RepID=A0A939J4M4_9HYPH|nr:hypothetical protein [Roseibium aggregatum]MBN9673738.1 hypothetical protein [Roseibium aggregatum]
MYLEILNHGEMSCEIQLGNTDGYFTGKLKFRTFEVGVISGNDEDSVCAQFKMICDLVDDGGMVRHDLIMLGYHNRAFKGEVLRTDGEIIGEWVSDDEEWCHFTATDASKITCSAPSPWLLHDAIAGWIEKGQHSEEG